MALSLCRWPLLQNVNEEAEVARVFDELQIKSGKAEEDTGGMLSLTIDKLEQSFKVSTFVLVGWGGGERGWRGACLYVR